MDARNYAAAISVISVEVGARVNYRPYRDRDRYFYLGGIPLCWRQQRLDPRVFAQSGELCASSFKTAATAFPTAHIQLSATAVQQTR